MNRNRRHLIALTAMSLLIAIAGCSDRTPTSLEIARAPVDPLVFDDDFSEDVYFQPFFETFYLAVQRDSVFAYNGFAPDGARSLKITIPPAGSALGPYSGGVFTASGSRDLSDFNALTFYARCDQLIQMNTLGFGNDNTGNSLYEAGRANVVLNPTWTFVVIPIPVPAKLISERGLFTFAEGQEARFPQGHHVWVDEIRYAKLGNITDPTPSMPAGNKQYFIGSTATIEGTQTQFLIDGAPVVVSHLPGYFDFQSSNPGVANVVGDEIRIVGAGDATITATTIAPADWPTETIDVDGSLVLTGHVPPTVAAAPPTLPAEDVISMFSDVYQNVPVDAWNTFWQYSTAQVEDYVVAGDNNKLYSSLNFVGIEFLNPTIDATEMTHFHLDVYAPTGTNFKVKLIAFDANGSYAGETLELTFDATTTPAFNAGGWSSLDIPLEDFQLGVSWQYMGQLALVTDDAQLVLVDNVYWHR